MRRLAVAASMFTGFLLAGSPDCAAPASSSAPIQYYQLANGFVPEAKNDAGFPAGPTGSGFARANPWGQYTAYIMATNAKGQRTWRIEHNLPNPNGLIAQGSTMYLLEGSKRALLIDTANPAKFTLGVDDLKTVVRYLLGHANSGAVKSDPLDFVVANTHSHGDHTGENVLMSDRTIYYMDLDWPPRGDASNYVPIREGGGATANGNGMAVGEIDLGDRKVTAVAMPPHTKGSTGYLDAQNNMLFSGDALGSSWPYIQGGPLTTYAASAHHVEEVTRPYPKLAVLPAHFYQTLAWGRKEKPLGREYIIDQAKNADGILAGTIVGEPFMAAGRNTYWARHASAQTVYSLDTLYAPGETPAVPYHAVKIPGSFPAKWVTSDTVIKAWSIKADLYLIRDASHDSLFLIKGSKEALLIGTGAGDPGLAALVTRLTGRLPLSVVLSNGDADQLGGLSQLHPRMVYGAPGLAGTVGGAPFKSVQDGDHIALGQDKAGRPLTLQVETFGSHGGSDITLIDVNDRLLFAGNALGTQGPGLALHIPLKDFSDDFVAWRKKTDGLYDIVYTAHNAQWFTDPVYVDQMGEAIAQGLSPSSAGKSAKSSGKPDVVANLSWEQ